MPFALTGLLFTLCACGSDDTPSAAKPAVANSVVLPAAPASATVPAASAPATLPDANSGTQTRATLADVKNIVVIYAENRGFDNLYGHFPGANGLQNVTAEAAAQKDRDGSTPATLPKVPSGLTGSGEKPAVTEAMTSSLPNAPFAIDDPKGFNVAAAVPTRDLVHRFYQNQMQINGGKNDMFSAWSDAGALAMGHYSPKPEQLPLWNVARQYVLADNFFMGAFGGSFLNHQYLICACAPYYPNAAKSPAADKVAVLDPDGKSLAISRNSPVSALSGPPKFVKDGSLSPDFYAVNTMQPPYQPSGNAPADQGDPAYANPRSATTLPAQTATHIGDLMTRAGVSWAWYGGAWDQALQAALARQKGVIYGNDKTVPNFQPHHQPFNYYANQAPGTESRARHLLDGGPDGSRFIEAIDAGKLPQVAFYKPQGNLNEHPGYTDVTSGDTHIADVIAHLQKSPQWPNMVVIVTYDENGGFWDHAAPPKGDRWGPGTRIPALIVSPFAKRGHVDHTQYDTASILRLITRRFSLPVLAGIKQRDEALVANGFPAMGDLTNALDLAEPVAAAN